VNPSNYLEEDSLLTSDEIQVRDSVREFVTDEVVPLLQKAHRDEVFPTQLIPRFGELGLLGSTLKDYGGAGLGDVAYGLTMMELERGDSGIRSFCSVQGALVIYPINTYGSDEQKRKYLPRLIRGEIVGCFGLTEAGAGSNPGGMLTTAEKVSGGYRLNGNKMWITNGSLADIAVVWAKLDGEVRGFIVEKGTPGFSVSTMTGKFSLRVSVTSELHFHDCVVPEDALLANAKGLKAPLSCLTQARYGIAWGVLGAADLCYRTALDYALTRDIFDGKTLAQYQLAQAKLVEMVTELTKGKLMVIQAGRLKEKDELKPHHVSMIKGNNCKVALKIAREARDMLGAHGIIDEYPIIRHMLNLETVNTYEGTEDIHRLVVGQAITGHAAFR
jgi:glutaryl-CoA dehydrogenase